MFTTQRLAVSVCLTVLLIGSSPLPGQESETAAGVEQLSAVLTSLHQKLGQQPAPSIDMEITALLSLEDDYRGPGPCYFFKVWLQDSVRIGQEPTFTAIFVLSRILTAVFVIFASRYLTTTYKVEAAGIESARRIFATSVLQST